MKTPIAVNRFVIADEDGPLRAFNTRSEALFFMSEGMALTVLPKPPKPSLDQFEEAPF